VDRIALANHAFDKHSGIDPSHSIMRLFHVAQDARFRLGGLGVDRDHFAARVTLENRDHRLRSDPQRSADKFVLGEALGARRERTERVAAVLRESGFDVTVTDDIRGEIWTKLIGNAAFNPLSVIARARVDEIMDDAGLGRIALRTMHEVAAVAAASGAPSGMDIEKRYAINAELGAFRTSMLQDYEAGRTLELGGLVDAVVEIGAKLGVETPMTEALGAFARRAAAVRDRVT